MDISVEVALIAAAASVFGVALKGLFDCILERIRRKHGKVDQITRIENKLDAHIASDAVDKADAARARILRFGDEVKQRIEHTEEHWDEILSDIDKYENYCASHDGYKNNKAGSTIRYLKDVYQHLLETNNFL